MKRLLVSAFRRAPVTKFKFGDFDPKNELKKAMEKAKKAFNNNSGEDENNNYHKYAMGLAIYLAACFGMYEFKKEKARPISLE